MPRHPGTRQSDELGSDPKSATRCGDHHHVDGLYRRLSEPPGKCLDQRESLLAPLLHVSSRIALLRAFYAANNAFAWSMSGCCPRQLQKLARGQDGQCGYGVMGLKAVGRL